MTKEEAWQILKEYFEASRELSRELGSYCNGKVSHD